MITLAAVRPRQAGLVIALTVAWVGAIALIIYGYDATDLRDYRESLHVWLSGEQLYGLSAPDTGRKFDYPPFAAYLLTPLIIWPAPLAVGLMTLVNLAALTFCVHVLLSPIRRAKGWPVAVTLLAASLVAAAIEPVRQTLGYGQLSLILVAAILADFIAIRNGRRWAGVGIGLAGAMQLTFLLFVVYLLLCRRWRAALTSVATIVVLSVVSLLLLPEATGAYLSTVLFNPDWVGQIGDTDNQALSGLMARLYDQAAPTITWLGFALFGAAWGLSRAVDSHRAGNEIAAVTIVGLTATVFSPVGWSYQLVWVVPALAVLLAWAMEPAPRRARKALMERPLNRRIAITAVWLLFVITPISWVGTSPDGGWAEDLAKLIGANSFFIAAVLLIGLLPREVRFTEFPAIRSAARTESPDKRPVPATP